MFPEPTPVIEECICSFTTIVITALKTCYAYIEADSSWRRHSARSDNQADGTRSNSAHISGWFSSRGVHAFRRQVGQSVFGAFWIELVFRIRREKRFLGHADFQV